MRAFTLGLLAAALALPAASRAREKLAVLAVDEPPGPGPELAAIAGRLRAAASERDPQGVLDARALRERMTPVSSAALSELDESFEAARAAAVRHDFEGSLKTLQALIESLERRPDSDETFSRWTRAMLRVAKTESDLGRLDAARRTLDRLVRAAPDLSVDPELYPPKLVGSLQEARTALRALPHSRLTVTSSEKGARVAVGGRDVGAAPATVSLAPGRYRISGVASGLRTPPMTVDLGAQDLSVALSFEAARALRPDGGPGLALPRAHRDRILLDVCAALQLEQVLAVRLEEERGLPFAVGSLWDVRRSQLKRERRVRLGADRRLDDAAAAELAQLLLAASSESPADPPRARPPEGLSEIPAAAAASAPSPAADVGASAPRGNPAVGWISVGSGAAAVALGGVALWQGLSARSSYADARGMLGSDGFLRPGGDLAQYQKALQVGDDARGKAIGAGIGAGICAIASGVLGYLAYRQTGEIGPFRF